MKKDIYLKIRSEIGFKKKLSPLAKNLSLDIGLIFAIYFLSSKLSAIFCIPLIAILMFRNFSQMHDASHWALIENKKINDLIGIYSGILCFLPFETWRRSHQEHHLWSGNIDKDPVMALRLILPKMDPRITHVMTFCWKLWVPILGVSQNFLFWILSIKMAFNSKNSKQIISIFAPLVTLGTLCALASKSFIFQGLVPGIILYLLGVEVVNFPHHLQIPMATGDKRFNMWEQETTARSCIYPEWFAKLVVLNFNYHIEHHLYPDAPWYYLPQIHQRVKAELGNKMNVEVMFDWTRQNRGLNIIEVMSANHPCLDLNSQNEEKKAIAA